MSEIDTPSSNYALLTAKELQSTVHSILEPRVLLAEDEFARVVSLSRRAVRIWRGIDRLEKSRQLGTVSSSASSSKELDEIKDALEIALDDDDEVLILGVEKDLSKLLQRHGLDDDLGAEMVPQSQGVADIGRGRETSGGVRSAGAAAAAGGAATVVAAGAAAGSAAGLAPDAATAANNVKLAELGGSGEGKISTYQKALCLSAIAWILVFTGCAIAIALLTRHYIEANDNSFRQLDRERAASLDMPPLTFCHVEDNIPAFFGRTDGVVGAPTLGVRFLQNLETDEIIRYPRTRDYFEEVVVAKGDEEEREACMKRMRTFDSSTLVERASRGVDLPQCRSCLRLRSNASLTLQNPDTKDDIASERTGIIYNLASLRFLTFCIREEKNAQEKVTGLAETVHKEIAEHRDGLLAKGVLDLSDLRPCQYNSKQKLFELLQQIPAEGTRYDPNGGRYHTFVCNLYFFSGYFYPNGGKMQRWKFFKRNGTFTHVGGAPPFEVKVELPSQAKPTNLPEPVSAFDAPEDLSDFPEGGDPEIEGDDPFAAPPGVERQLAAPDSIPDAPESGGEDPFAAPASVPDAPDPGAQDYVDNPCEYHGRGRYPPTSSKPFELPEPEIVPSKAGNPGYLPHISVYSNATGVNTNNVDVQSDKAFVDIEPTYLLMRLGGDSEVSLAIQRDVEFADSRYVPEKIDTYRINVGGGSMPPRALGHYSFSFRVSFANFFEEKLVPKSTYTLSEYLADLLNMLGIFLGVSVFAVLLVPASMYLVRKGVTKK